MKCSGLLDEIAVSAGERSVRVGLTRTSRVARRARFGHYRHDSDELVRRRSYRCRASCRWPWHRYSSRRAGSGWLKRLLKLTHSASYLPSKKGPKVGSSGVPGGSKLRPIPATRDLKARLLSLTPRRLFDFAVKVVHLDHHVLGDLALHADAETERMRSLKGAVNGSRR